MCWKKTIIQQLLPSASQPSNNRSLDTSQMTAGRPHEQWIGPESACLKYSPWGEHRTSLKEGTCTQHCHKQIWGRHSTWLAWSGPSPDPSTHHTQPVLS